MLKEQLWFHVGFSEEFKFGRRRALPALDTLERTTTGKHTSLAYRERISSPSLAYPLLRRWTWAPDRYTREQILLHVVVCKACAL
jgi:hypothetical protein